MDLREQVGVERDVGKILRARGHVGETGVERGEKLPDVEAQVLWGVGFEIPMHALMKLAGPANVAVAEMIEGNRGLDEPLVKLPGRPPVFRPQLFPDLVALVIVAGIELLDAVEIQRFVGGRCVHESNPARCRHAPGAWGPRLRPARRDAQ